MIEIILACEWLLAHLLYSIMSGCQISWSATYRVLRLPYWTGFHTSLGSVQNCNSSVLPP